MEISRRASQRAGPDATPFCHRKQYFLKHGYAGTSMSAIAAELGGSEGDVMELLSVEGGAVPLSSTRRQQASARNW